MTLTVEDDYKVFSYYLSDFEVGVKFSLRDNDNTPSCLIDEFNGRLHIRDWGISQTGTSSIDFIILMEKSVTTFKQGLAFYYKNIKNSKTSVRKIQQKIFEARKRTKTKSKPTIQYDSNYTESELNYWSKRLQSKEDLIREEIYGLRALSWGNSHPISSTSDRPKFVYKFGEDSWKVYNPLVSKEEKRYKWQSHNIANVIEGYAQLPKDGKELIITASRKDGLCLNKLTGVACCNGSSESSWRVFVEKKEELKERFKNISILYDDDKAGITASKKLSLLTGFKYLSSKDSFLYCKDIDEMLQKYGYTASKEALNRLL